MYIVYSCVHTHTDLYGLVLFLDLDPYSQSLWYRRLISWPYQTGREEAMVDLFSSIMWRSSKEDVAEEVGRGGEGMVCKCTRDYPLG